MLSEVVQDATLKRVTLATGKGALDTWRPWNGQRRVSEDPFFWDESGSKPTTGGVNAGQRLSLSVGGKASGEKAKVRTGTWEIRPSGIAGGPEETWPMVEL